MNVAEPKNSELSKAQKKCLSKRRFRSAEKAMLSIFFNPTETPLAPYKCAICRKWHITKDKQVVKKWNELWDIKILTRKFPQS
jgi:hypothetical protein